MSEEYAIDKTAFETPIIRGYSARASYLREPAGQAIVQIFHEGDLFREFFYPAYRIWNIAAHFEDLVCGIEDGKQ